MTWIMVDVEADGPCPGLYSMISLGAVSVDNPTNEFYARFAPITSKYVPKALAVSGFTREETLDFPKAEEGIVAFNEWLKQFPMPVMFISDNNGFDWQFVNYYFWFFLNNNPFGHSSTNLGSLYKGFVKNIFKNFKHLRQTPHTHHPVDDARGNVEAFVELKKMGLKM